MPKLLQPQLCYLCGKNLSEPTDKDHIPLKGLFPPEIRKKHKPTKLITVRVHKACNESYHFDEQYFLCSLYPFALGTYVGDTVAEDQSDRVNLSHDELSLLLGGIDLTRTRRKDWYRKTVPESEKV